METSRLQIFTCCYSSHDFEALILIYKKLMMEISYHAF